jgi:hypothetical protein
VVSTTLTDPEWNNTTVIAGDVPEEIAKLKGRRADPHRREPHLGAVADAARPDRRVPADDLSGRRRKRRAALARLARHNVLELALADTRKYDSGVVVNVYRRLVPA